VTGNNYLSELQLTRMYIVESPDSGDLEGIPQPLDGGHVIAVAVAVRTECAPVPERPAGSLRHLLPADRMLPSA
jgi:hypothetical protein